MSKAPLREGAAGRGKIRILVTRSGAIAAECRFRDSDGEVRPVRAQGIDANEATERLIAKLNARTGPPVSKEKTVIALTGPNGERLPDSLRTSGKISAHSTVGDATLVWLAKVSQDEDLKPQTRDYWRRVARQTVLKDIADSPVTLTAEDVKSYVVELARTKPGQARKARQMLSLVLDEAILAGAVTFNASRVIRLPKSIHKARKRSRARLKALTLEEHFEFVRAAAEWRNGRAGMGGAQRDPSFLVEDVIQTLAGTALRINELLGLRISDIDFTSTPPALVAGGTLIRLDGLPLRYQIGTKSREEGEAPLPQDRLALPAFAADALARQIRINGHHTYVFVTGAGNPVDASNIQRAFRSIRPEHLGFLTPHTYRRSVATWIKKYGSLAAASAQLRHEHESTTEESYIKERKDEATDNAGLLSELLKPRSDEPEE